MKKLFGTIILSITLALSVVAPASAVETRSATDNAALQSSSEATTQPTEIPATFQDTETRDLAQFRFGNNLLAAGNINALDEVTIGGLFFGFGNQVNLNTVGADYAFIAGNVVDYAARSEKDLFVAGATVNLLKDAHIGRDVYAAGNVVDIQANLNGDLSVAAARVNLHDVKIAGNVNLSVGELVIDGGVNIAGKLIINEDARIVGLEHAKYSELEKYVEVDYEPTAAELWVNKVYGIVGLFIIFAIILAIYSRLDRKISDRLTMANFGIDVIAGCVFLALVPILAVFLLISMIGAPAAIILIVLYIMVIYLSQAFAGFWFGKLVVEKIAHSQTNRFVEALLGITLLGCISMIPFVGWVVGLWSTVLGCGLIIQTIKPCKKDLCAAETPDQKTSQTKNSPAPKQIASKSSAAKPKTSAKTTSKSKTSSKTSSKKTTK